MTTPTQFGIDDVVRVSASVLASPTTAPFGRTLFLTDDNIDSVQSARVAEYANLAAFADFNPNDAPRRAAGAYFAQPGIKPPLLVGKWQAPTAATYLRGGTIGETPAQLVTREAAFSSGAALILGGVNIAYDDITFAGDTSYDDIADGLATGINGQSEYSGVTVAHVPVSGGNGYFRVNFSSTGPAAVFTDPSGGELAQQLGLTAGAGAYIEHPHGESAASNINAILDVNQDWYFLTLDPSLRDTRAVLDDNPGSNDIGLATVLNGHNRMLVMDTAEDDALTADETTSYAARVSALGLGRNAIIWSKRDYVGTALSSLFSSVRWTDRNSLITAAHKTLAGINADTITAAQRTELERKSVNCYVRIGDRTMLEPGVVPGVNRWMDKSVWLDWFITSVQWALFRHITSRPAGIPRDDRGQQSMLFAVEDVCRQGVVNGGIGPGDLSPALASEIANQTNDPEFTGYLSTGYKVWASPISEQNAAQRASRIAPLIYIWLHERGSIHGGDIAITIY